MVSLSSANSLFELAFAVNAVLPALVSEFERVKSDAADSLLKKVREARPQFELREGDRLEFIDFAYRSSPGLRLGWYMTRAVSVVSLLLCVLSLGALVWSASRPLEEIPDRDLHIFVALAFAVGPAFYVARDRYLRWIYSALVRSSDDPADAEFFAECADLYLGTKRMFERHERQIDELNAQLSATLLKARWTMFRVRVMGVWHKLRFGFLSRRKP